MWLVPIVTLTEDSCQRTNAPKERFFEKFFKKLLEQEKRPQRERFGLLLEEL
jgi:hypothetical protein